ncbi:hypothetical protein [Novosphingobium marinum]|uniref:Uncharacterized protein n=1 Tax=Novosphingobium marinum TaxID=1514948 RepID=A0A7Z0BX78_9SPHN|nr:hypothetical protein [Novosphingobium marinum]NYH97087.1 hypothetical protein [Novosphingobium marinum]
MKKPATVKAIEDLGRTRLSKSFFLRDFLYSDIAATRGMANHDVSHAHEWQDIEKVMNR